MRRVSIEGERDEVVEWWSNGKPGTVPQYSITPVLQFSNIA
jgi:hypothetical protein